MFRALVTLSRRSLADQEGLHYTYKKWISQQGELCEEFKQYFGNRGVKIRGRRLADFEEAI